MNHITYSIPTDFSLFNENWRRRRGKRRSADFQSATFQQVVKRFRKPTFISAEIDLDKQTPP